MSSEDLVEAYVDGRISRRTLIRRLVAVGVSVGAASAYAQLLQPRVADAHHVVEFYNDPGFYSDPANSPEVWGKVVTARKKQAVKKRKLKVRAGVRNESASLKVSAEIKLKGKWKKASKVKQIHHAVGGQTQVMELKLNKRARKALAKAKPKKVSVRVVAQATDTQNNVVTARATRRLG